MPAMYEVIRPIHGAGDHVFNPGEVVDASGWKSLDKLVAQRKLRPVTADVPPRPANTPHKPYTKGAQSPRKAA